MTAALVIAAGIAALVAVVAMGLLFCRLRELPPPDAAPGPPGASVSIIIPARNEEDNLRVLLPSILRQSQPPHEVIVVDDQSDDRTAAIAESHGCRLIRSRSLPDGWFGKPWACQQGADAADGEILLFLDADLELGPDALARLATRSARSPQAVISVCPWHRTEKAYEQLSVFFNLLMVGGIGAFTFRGDRARGIGLFGQTLWIRRSLYREIGGHRSVKATVLENLHLAGDLERRGIEKRCFIGRGSISMRMFPGGIRELMASWAKGFSSGARLTPQLAMTLSALWLSGLMGLAVLPLLLPLAGPGSLPWIGACHLVVAACLFALFRKVGAFSWWNALLFPASLFFYQALFAYSARRRRGGGTTRWKGRDVA